MTSDSCHTNKKDVVRMYKAFSYIQSWFSLLYFLFSGIFHMVRGMGISFFTVHVWGDSIGKPIWKWDNSTLKNITACKAIVRLHKTANNGNCALTQDPTRCGWGGFVLIQDMPVVWGLWHKGELYLAYTTLLCRMIYWDRIYGRDGSLSIWPSPDLKAVKTVKRYLWMWSLAHFTFSLLVRLRWIHLSVEICNNIL